jgi:hypothetical protein
MLWHENAGNGGTVLSQASHRTGPYHQDIFTKTRRMVVVKKLHGCSWCMYVAPFFPFALQLPQHSKKSPLTPSPSTTNSPIHTYSGQGVTKRGLSRQDIERHAVIHMDGTSSSPRADEQGIVKQAITVSPASPEQQLRPMSRLNFGKPYTVEHNIKAMDVGMVVQRSLPYLESYFKNVWDE